MPPAVPPASVLSVWRLDQVLWDPGHGPLGIAPTDCRANSRLAVGSTPLPPQVPDPGLWLLCPVDAKPNQAVLHGAQTTERQPYSAYIDAFLCYSSRLSSPVFHRKTERVIQMGSTLGRGSGSEEGAGQAGF